MAAVPEGVLEREASWVDHTTDETGSDARPVDSPPTNSMVTVRLSDVQIHPRVEIETPRSHSTRSSQGSPRSSTSSSSSRLETMSSESVNWDDLEKSEKQERQEEGTDESTALLLARLEQENAALAINPKSRLHGAGSGTGRPPSIQHLKKLVNGPQRQSLRYSLLPAPPMTELEFWAALVADYSQTAQRLPTLTSNKIRGGIPPPLRGVVWPSIAGARDAQLMARFQQHRGETSPYEGLIVKDIGRSFPNVDMFRDKEGEGQQMLGNVLKCFSLYDQEIGYCQGLGFVVGPLLMHMTDAEAFCVLVRLMEGYNLRSCYLPDLAGLHLRIHQFQTLLASHVPTLASHLESLKIEPLYVSQWFLSFFAVTCPLPMLLRIYDVMLAEGATETLMRVALSLMQRNEKKLLAFTEFEDAMQFLLSRSLWDTYAQHADDLVADFVSLTGLVTRESLEALEASFRDGKTQTVSPGLKSAASSLLGRFWAGSAHGFSKSGASLGLALPGASIRKTPSGHSLTSMATSIESTSEASTVATEASRASHKSDSPSEDVAPAVDSSIKGQDRGLHDQIEELLTALSGLQREQANLMRDLQREREERQEDQALGQTLLHHLEVQTRAIRDLVEGDVSEEELQAQELLSKAGQRFGQTDHKRTSIVLSKRQLHDTAREWQQKHELEAGRCKELMKQLDEREHEHAALREQLREARGRIQDGHREKQRLERTVQELRSRKSSMSESPSDTASPVGELSDIRLAFARPGLREFKLGKADPARASTSTSFSKRSSSLNAPSLVASETLLPAADDALLLELVNAKTAEAVARQELEETKSKLDSLRKILSGPTSSPAVRSTSLSDSPLVVTSLRPDANASATTSPKTAVESPKTAGSTAPAGGFFSGWGKRHG